MAKIKKNVFSISRIPFLSAIRWMFDLLLVLFKRVRQIDRKDTREEELQLFDRLITWAVILVIIMLFVVLAGWEYVFMGP